MKIRAVNRDFINEFVQWTGDNYDELKALCGDALGRWDVEGHTLRLRTQFDWKAVPQWYYVAQHNSFGHFLLLKPETFEKDFLVLE